MSHDNDYNRSIRPLYQKAHGVSQFCAHSGFLAESLLLRHNPACVAPLTPSLRLLRRFAYCVASFAVPHRRGGGDIHKKCAPHVADALRLWAMPVNIIAFEFR
jgi:hypothetical protein